MCRRQVEAAPGHKFSLTPYFSIIIGVTLSVLLCLLLSFVKRGVRNRRLRCAAPRCPALCHIAASCTPSIGGAWTGYVATWPPSPRSIQQSADHRPGM
jgi:hypothetical protein